MAIRYIYLLYALGNTGLLSGLNFTEFESPTGAFLIKRHDTYISYNNWKLLYYYDLYDIHNNFENYRECIEKMEYICQKIPKNNQCETLITQHKNTLININSDIEYLKNMQNDQPYDISKGFTNIQQNYRNKRAIFGFWGTYVMNPLFGLMDEDTAQDITQKINQLVEQNQQKKILLEDNMSIIKQTLQITNTTFEIYNSNLRKLDEYINKLTREISDVEKEIKYHIDFEYISSTAILLSVEHDRYIELIKNAPKNTLYGDFTSFITFEQLTKNLKEIANNLDDTPYLILDKLRDIQQIVSIRGTIVNKRLILELDIPMISKNQLHLYKIIPLPIRKQNNIIAINLKENMFLVDNITKTYIPVRTQELTLCKYIFGNSLLCFPQAEIYFENNKNCESNILFQHAPELTIENCGYNSLQNINYVKQITENTYFISTKNNLVVRENCLKQGTKLYTLNSTGIIKIRPNCEIILSGMKILAKSYQIREQIYEAALSNKLTKILIRNITAVETRLDNIKPPRTVFLNSNDNFHKLINETEEKIRKIKDMGDISYLQSDLFLKNTSAWITIIIIILIIRFIYKKFC